MASGEEKVKTGKQILIPLESEKAETTQQQPFQITVRTMGNKRRVIDGQEKAKEPEDQKD